MGDTMITVTKTYLPNKNKYIEKIDEIYDSGWVTNNGQMVKKLEERLEKYLGVKNLLLVTNGTLALQIAYKLLNLKNKVITTPFSFVATTSSLVWEGLTPKFVDINPSTFNIDEISIEGAIDESVSAVLPVHVYGNPCNVEAIEKIAEKYALKIIYDASHAFNIRYKEESILNYGDISVISFHATKIFHCIEGGALIIKDDKLYEKAKKMINFGIIGPEQIETLGINCKMTEFQAAMGICVLDDYELIESERKKAYDIYNSKLHDITLLKSQERNKYSNNNYSYYPILFESEEVLKKVIKELNNHCIYPRRYFYPSLNTLNYLDYCKMPMSESISSRILCLPIYYGLSEREQNTIISVITKELYNKQ